MFRRGGKENIVDLISEFTDIRNEVCMKYCSAYGIDLLHDIIDYIFSELAVQV